MSFSPVQRANYVELANEYLDKLPVSSVEDFKTAQIALQKLLRGEEPSEGSWEEGISELLRAPELYVEKKEQYPEFQYLVIERIRKKVLELAGLSQEEREAILAEKAKRKSETAKNHETMRKRKAPEPDSKAHVLSDEEWYALLLEQRIQPDQLERLLDQEEAIQPNQLQRLLNAVHAQAMQDVRRWDREETLRVLRPPVNQDELPTPTKEKRNIQDLEREALEQGVSLTRSHRLQYLYTGRKPWDDE